MEEQAEETSLEDTLSEKTISDEEFDQLSEDDDEWDSVSLFSGISETSTSSNFSSSSSVWLYFDKSPAYAPDYNVCQKCSKKYNQATSVTVLRKHLQGHKLDAPTRTEKKNKKSDPLSKKEQKEHDKYLVQWLIRNLQPFTVVDNPSFRDFINHLCSRYVLPGRHKAKGNKTNLFFLMIMIITNFLLYKYINRIDY